MKERITPTDSVSRSSAGAAARPEPSWWKDEWQRADGPSRRRPFTQTYLWAEEKHTAVSGATLIKMEFNALLIFVAKAKRVFEAAEDPAKQLVYVAKKIQSKLQGAGKRDSCCVSQMAAVITLNMHAVKRCRCSRAP